MQGQYGVAAERVLPARIAPAMLRHSLQLPLTESLVIANVHALGKMANDAHFSLLGRLKGELEAYGLQSVCYAGGA